MQLISSHNGKLVRVDAAGEGLSTAPGFWTGFKAVDRLLPGGGLARGAVHEVLWKAGDPRPVVFGAVLAAVGRGTVVWSDRRGELYPPGLVRLGIGMDRLMLLRASGWKEEAWAIGQCLACRGVGAVVAEMGRLTRVESRRLQLAAQRGGGMGVFLRRVEDAAEHAATTRWLVEPAAGERIVQRWKITLIGGHGGRLYRPVYLECIHGRVEGCVRAVEVVADHVPASSAAG